MCINVYMQCDCCPGVRQRGIYVYKRVYECDCCPDVCQSRIYVYKCVYAM